jgi:protein O-GlcNAc transferase
VLRRIPRSRLLFRFRDRYASAALRKRVLDALTGAGIAAERIHILDREVPNIHPLEIYNRIDVALDPVPFTGSTTTFESLWMGVPVVTLRGETMVGRWSSSMLKAVRLERFIADTPEAYVAVAARLASDPDGLGTLRTGLRRLVAESPLCDGRRRARQFERLCRALWRRWCAQAKGS